MRKMKKGIEETRQEQPAFNTAYLVGFKDLRKRTIQEIIL
jgi:hypothetical protein